MAPFSFDYKILLAERTWQLGKKRRRRRRACLLIKNNVIAFTRSRLILQMHKKDRDCRVRWAMDCRTSKENSHEMENVPWNHFSAGHYKLRWLSIVHHYRVIIMIFFPYPTAAVNYPTIKGFANFFSFFRKLEVNGNILLSNTTTDSQCRTDGGTRNANLNVSITNACATIM